MKARCHYLVILLLVSARLITFFLMTSTAAEAVKIPAATAAATPLSAAQISPQQQQNWLVVDFDGTCTARDTTPLLPKLAALLGSTGDDDNDASTKNMNERLATFHELEAEYFRLYMSARKSLCPQTMSLDEALDSLDNASSAITKKVSASGILRGLSVPSEDILSLFETNDDLKERVRLHENCAEVLARVVASQTATKSRCNRGWNLGILSINWCPPLIEAALLQPIRQHHKDIIEQEKPSTTLSSSLSTIPIWSNAIDHSGVVSLQVPGALAKKARITKLKHQQQTSIGGRGLIVYVGDSLTDLSALLEADIGILIGYTQSVVTMAEQWTVDTVPLCKWNDQHLPQNQDAEASSQTIWLADSWCEIEDLLKNLVIL